MNKIEEAAKYGKLIHQAGLVIGAGGNISVRDGSAVIIKKKAADMSLGRTEDYISIPLTEMEQLDNDELSSETPLHTACYKTSESVGAVVHVHSPYAIAASEKTKLLKSTSYEFDCIIQKAVPVIDYIQPGSSELGEAVAEKIKEGATAVLLKKHGPVSVGKDLEEAYLRILALERACLTFLHS